ncbi:hypothetical protein A1O3_04498 [Capronia epimyces CBS 606.96]|uniref:Uncharacterized protein n=1 Tax=Capronia epimyces CBS 606.96 TaxID=1182542 RepID=W9Y4U9_9EURO|nr:uncharacterized protein A1O3_04498 [Capronia epimyces CBS 606.96]EXJ87538.1 hypothetical protein A1O3_04498 [Capronia epimyces CBS 606.96]
MMLSAALCSVEQEKKQTSSGLTFALQALLTRHESYVTESQLEHERLTAYINELERERATLQTTNERIVVENRELRTQLDTANTSLRDSDKHVKGLEALLRDSELEIRRLNGLTRQAEELELKILDMEKDHAVLLQKAGDSKEEARNTMRRWKESDLRVRQLESDIQRIEWEARQEMERHEELVARLERERVLERELGGAEGRLKGAAALQGLKGGATGAKVVSHFVRDILQDNANLQAGIAELRELLQTSNDEVQSLREQIFQHQPVEYDDSQEEGASSRPLSEQLGWPAPPFKQVQQEVHVHHHYHAKIAGKRDRNLAVRKPVRRRAVMGVGTLPTTPESSHPTTPLSAPQRVVSSPVLPIALHFPQARRQRWSVQSAATTSSAVSSFPSSPQSYYEHNSSIFDRIEGGEESSRPTSPESAAGFADPPFLTIRRKASIDEGLTDPREDDDEDDGEARDTQPEAPYLASSPPLQDSLPSDSEKDEPIESDSHELTPKPSQILVTGGPANDLVDPEPPDRVTSDTSSAFPVSEPIPSPLTSIQQTTEDVPDNPDERKHIGGVSGPSSSSDFDVMHQLAIQPGRRRAGSHESLVSISGMDIHLAKRPTTSTSQSSSLLKGNKAYFAMSPSATRTFSTAPLATVTEFTALSSMRSLSADAPAWTDTVPGDGQASDRNTSMSVEALSGLVGLPTGASQQRHAPAGGLGRLVGSWVRGKWGIAPVKSGDDSRPSTSATSASSSSSSSLSGTQALLPFQLPGGRPPGINQNGAIPGFKPTRKPPSTGVQVLMMDAEGLKDILAE